MYSVVDQYLAEKKQRELDEMSPVTGKPSANYEDFLMQEKPQVAQAPAQAPQADPSQAAMQGAMTGAAGGPAGAAIGAGGSLITSYLAQKAADERARRDRAALIEDQYADNQDKGFNTQLLGLRGALR